MSLEKLNQLRATALRLSLAFNETLDHVSWRQIQVINIFIKVV